MSENEEVNSACGDDDVLPATLKYQRTEYAKKIRKDYESGKIKERRCNLREWTLRKDGLCNTISTVQKDNYVAVRDTRTPESIGGGNEDESEDEECDNDTWLLKKYKKFYRGYGYIPKYFHPYGCAEVTDYHPTLLAESYGSFGHCGTVLILEENEE